MSSSVIGFMLIFAFALCFTMVCVITDKLTTVRKKQYILYITLIILNCDLLMAQPLVSSKVLQTVLFIVSVVVLFVTLFDITYHLSPNLFVSNVSLYKHYAKVLICSSIVFALMYILMPADYPYCVYYVIPLEWCYFTAGHVYSRRYYLLQSHYARIMFVLFCDFLFCLAGASLHNPVCTCLGLVMLYGCAVFNNSDFSYDTTCNVLRYEIFTTYLQRLITNEKKFTIIAITVPSTHTKKLWENIPTDIPKWLGTEHKPVLFKGNDRTVYCLIDDLNAEEFDKFSRSIYALYKQCNTPYKLVLARDNGLFSQPIEYIEYIRYLGNCTDYLVPIEDSDDLRELYKLKQHLQSLIVDISTKCDMEDPRVVVYCQPVFNTKTDTFTTAEALMRLMDDNGTLYYPDMFIPIAESCGCVHNLNLILLHKVSCEIDRLLKDDYLVDRITVNFNMIEVQMITFVDDILRALTVNPDYIGIEITESVAFDNLTVVRSNLECLHDNGFILYLDDFGTGYSNLNRVLSLPFDVVKFDKSLTNAACSSDRNNRVVCNLANLFITAGCTVLFEGVETKVAELQCAKLHAHYLQGYLYSKPIPICELRRYLTKRGDISNVLRRPSANENPRED